MQVGLLAFVMVTFSLPLDGAVSAASPLAPSAIPFGGTDFKQYYTTSRLLLEGKNPYDYELAGVIQRGLGETGDIQVPYGPPTCLLPFIPMGWFDFLTAIQIQFVLNVGMLVICCFLWGKMLFPTQPMMPLFSCIAVVAWIPCLSLFGMGHVTSWTLFGFTLWAFCMQQKRPALAGCLLALSIIKPHLAFGPVIYACVVGLRQKQWSMLTCFTLTVLAMIGATFVIRPSVWTEYLGSLAQSNPTQWFNATLDGWGRFQFGASFRLVTIIVGCLLLGWIALLGWKRNGNDGPLVLALWLAATPYAFSYDYVLVLPGFILAMGAWLYRTHPYWHVAVAGWLLLDVLYVMKKGEWTEYKFFFIPWGACMLTLLLWPPSVVETKPSLSNTSSA